MQQNEQIEHILYIRWHGNAGQTKLNRVGLKRLDNGVDSLKDLPKELINSHYPNSRDFPDYFTNADYVRFTPQVECLVLPGDVVRTELRLALSYQGWEYTVLKKDSSHSSNSGAGQDIQVMTAEFMGSDPFMALLGLRMALIAYPVVALSRVFLDDVHQRLLAAPEAFKGML
ncbi:hypothetical protein OEZ85_002749 [Tetradesmus obliquus]|uniref:Uncharacterized protein n=1 Tax=Tetradesmus obliquus TaxID=3088 RepID=A0ABY8TZ14_TETOB|nr:hypothetical protein OEZ85_002749 [Tetradesmus obliquus]